MGQYLNKVLTAFEEEKAVSGGQAGVQSLLKQLLCLLRLAGLLADGELGLTADASDV